jgi:hypothetical protein
MHELYSLPLYGYTKICLFAHWLVNIWVFSAIMSKVAMNIQINFHKSFNVFHLS